MVRDEAWEGTTGRRPPWAVAVALVALVVLGGLLARPAADPSGTLRVSGDPGGGPAPVPDAARDGDGDGRTGGDAEDGDGRADGEGAGSPTSGVQREGDVAVLHALNTASLEPRVPPLRVALDGRRLRSAVTSRGLQRLVLALEDPPTGETRMEVRDSSSLELVADLGTQPGPTEHLQLGPEAEAVVWVRPGRGGAPGAVHRQPFTPAGRASDALAPPGHRSAPLPTGMGPVVGMQTLRGGRVAVAGADAAGALRVLVYELAGGRPGPVVDVAVPGGLGADAPPLVWDAGWSLLHVPHPRGGGLTTVDLATGEVAATTVEPGVRAAGGDVVDLRAALLQDAVVVVTGTLHRRVQPVGVDLVQALPLEPLGFFAAGGRPQLRWRGEAGVGDVVATAGGRAVFALATGATDGASALSVVAADGGGLQRLGRAVELEGEVLDVALDASHPRLTAVRERSWGTVVSRHGWGEATGPVIERHFAPGATVHLSGIVVVELP